MLGYLLNWLYLPVKSSENLEKHSICVMDTNVKYDEKKEDDFNHPPESPNLKEPQAFRYGYFVTCLTHSVHAHDLIHKGIMKLCKRLF